jgi:hypothetical protein
MTTMNRSPFARRPTTLKDVALLLFITAWPALALVQVARSVAILGGMWGEAVTVEGRTPAGYQVVLTSYQPTE